jgi:hypothetical protein
MRRKRFCAKSATWFARPITPSTLPTQMRASPGGTKPRFVAGFQGQNQRRVVQASASPSDMPTSGLSALTVNS